jgi:hypothetical protein
VIFVKFWAPNEIGPSIHTPSPSSCLRGLNPIIQVFPHSASRFSKDTPRQAQGLRECPFPLKGLAIKQGLACGAAHGIAVPDRRGFGGWTDRDFDFVEPVFIERLTGLIKGQLFAIAVTTEVDEENFAQFGSGDIAQELGGGAVGQVSLTAEGPLLDEPGPFSFLNEGFIVIGFDYQGMAALQAFAQERRGDPHIGYDPDTVRAAANDKGHRIISIVRHGKGFDLQIADHKRTAVGKDTPRKVPVFDLGGNSLSRARIGIKRDLMTFVQNRRPTGVVLVFMTETNPVDLRNIKICTLKSTHHFAAAKTGIDQDRGLL